MKLLDKLKQYLLVTREELDILCADITQIESANQERELMIRNDIRVLYDFIQEEAAKRATMDKTKEKVEQKPDEMYG